MHKKALWGNVVLDTEPHGLNFKKYKVVASVSSVTSVSQNYKSDRAGYRRLLVGTQIAYEQFRLIRIFRKLILKPKFSGTITICF